MDGKIALVTGSTDGIGKWGALRLAEKGATVLLHGRNAVKGKIVRAEIIESTGNKNVHIFTADLTSLDTVRNLCTTIQARFNHLDLLINNAATIEMERRLTPDGHETTFAVNYLAPFLITLKLLPLLSKSAASRVLNVNARLHAKSLDFENLQGEKQYDPVHAYAISKLCNIMFTYDLAERLEKTAIDVNCFHPGVINTKLLRRVFGGRPGLPDESETLNYLSTSSEVQGISGKFFADSKPEKTAPISYNTAVRQRLWQHTETLLEEQFPR